MKSFVILLGAGLVNGLLKRHSAATRHFIWFLALSGLILLPLLPVILPEWRMAIIPPALSKFIPAPSEAVSIKVGNEEKPVAALSDSQSDIVPSALAQTGLRIEQGSKTETTVQSAPRVTPPLRLAKVIQVVWCAGTALVLFPLLMSSFSVWRTSRKSRLMTTGSTASLVQELALTLGIQKPVKVLQTSQTTMPVTWGFWRHTILLPDTFATWPDERQRLVILHELAHISRRDCLTQFMGWIGCSLFWFNPLGWVALRQMRVERERACDDIVLSQSIKASNYATHLLEIARTCRSSVPASMAAIAMAKPTQLEGRLLAILEPLQDRRSMSKAKAIFILAAVSLLILPLAAGKTTGWRSQSRGRPNAHGPQFVQGKSYIGGEVVREAIEGDLNLDGRPDLVILNAGTNTISIFENISRPGSQSIELGEKIDLEVGRMPLHAKVVDIDGDGRLDIIVSNHGSDFLSVFRNINNSGRIDKNSFAPPIRLMTQRAPHFLDVGDLNHDGRPEIAVSNNGNGRGSSISIFENTSSSGQISFGGRFDLTTGMQPVCVVLADLDADGWADIIVANHLSKTISIFPNFNRGWPISGSSFPQKLDFPAASGPFVIEVSDLDGDDKPDISLSNNSPVGALSVVSIFKNLSVPGQVAFGPRSDLPAGNAGAAIIAVKDVNHDGWPDLFVGHQNGEGIAMFLNLGNASQFMSNSFAPAVELNTGPFGGFRLVDLDGDGHLDIVALRTDSSSFSIHRSLGHLPE